MFHFCDPLESNHDVFFPRLFHFWLFLHEILTRCGQVAALQKGSLPAPCSLPLAPFAFYRFLTWDLHPPVQRKNMDSFLCLSVIISSICSVCASTDTGEKGGFCIQQEERRSCGHGLRSRWLLALMVRQHFLLLSLLNARYCATLVGIVSFGHQE